MNLGEAITFVLKNRSKNILQDFLREDVAGVIGGVIADGSTFFRESRENLKTMSLKDLPGNLLDSASEIAELVRVLPRRIQKALSEFQNDLLAEIDRLPEAREKVLFCFRVFGILTTSTFSTFYNLQNSRSSLSLGKVKLRSAFAKFLVAELVIRSVKLFALRFLQEVEEKVTAPEDVEHLRYYRRMLDSSEAQHGAVSETDPAFRITEKLKKIILNGDDEA